MAERGLMPRCSRSGRREHARQAAEQVGFRASGGESETHAAGGFDDAGGDLDEAQPQSCELGLRQVARLGNGVADGRASANRRAVCSTRRT